MPQAARQKPQYASPDELLHTKLPDVGGAFPPFQEGHVGFRRPLQHLSAGRAGHHALMKLDGMGHLLDRERSSPVNPPERRPLVREDAAPDHAAPRPAPDPSRLEPPRLCADGLG